MYNEIFNGMFGKAKPGYCRLAMNGKIAVNTTGGYKSYDVKTGRLTNCTNFVFPGNQDMFFIIPTNNVQVGDIIKVNGTARCVVKVEKNQIQAVNYETSAIETIIPERHIFMGNTYFYGKVVSMFGNFAGKGKDGVNSVMKYMMMSEMLSGLNGDNSNSNLMNTMMMMAMMSGSNPFGEAFNFSSLMGSEDEDNEEAETEAE